MSHPAEDFINAKGTWENGPEGHSFVFELEDGTGETFQAECYWGGLEWTVETDETKHSFWFPRLISGVYCDYYNKYFWLIGAMIAGIILFVISGIGAVFNIRKTDKLSKQNKENRQKQ